MMTYINKTSFDVICMFENCFIDIDGNIIIFDQNNFENICQNIFITFSESERKNIKNHFIPAWLVYKGYILVKNSKAYYFKKPSNQQLKVISCIWYKGMLIDRNTKLAKNVLKKRVIERCMGITTNQY